MKIRWMGMMALLCGPLFSYVKNEGIDPIQTDGLWKSPSANASLTPVFAKPFTVIVGMADTDPNSSDLRYNPQSDAQGMDRLEGAQYFSAAATTLPWPKTIPLTGNTKPCPAPATILRPWPGLQPICITYNRLCD